jgi:hypothetical protein
VRKIEASFQLFAIQTPGPAFGCFGMMLDCGVPTIAVFRTEAEAREAMEKEQKTAGMSSGCKVVRLA